MGDAAAYDQAMQQFQACLHAAGATQWQALGFCGYAAGQADGAWSALGRVHTWQAVAAGSWFVSGLLVLVCVWLLLRRGRRLLPC